MKNIIIIKKKKLDFLNELKNETSRLNELEDSDDYDSSKQKELINKIIKVQKSCIKRREFFVNFINRFKNTRVGSEIFYLD